MFTIDLLKGQGVPMRITPLSMAVIATATLVPVTAAIMIFGFYLRDRVMVSIQKQQIDSYTARMEETSDAVKHYDDLDKERRIQRDCLKEVGALVNRHYQWSGIIATLIETLPDSLILSEMQVEDRTIKREVPDEDNPERMVEVLIPAKTLVVTVRDAGKPDSNAVRQFRECLCASAVLGPILENVVVSQESTVRNDKNIIFYEIHCMLKSKI